MVADETADEGYIVAGEDGEISSQTHFLREYYCGSFAGLAGCWRKPLSRYTGKTWKLRWVVAGGEEGKGTRLMYS